MESNNVEQTLKKLFSLFSLVEESNQRSKLKKKFTKINLIIEPDDIHNGVRGFEVNVGDKFMAPELTEFIKNLSSSSLNNVSLELFYISFVGDGWTTKYRKGEGVIPIEKVVEDFLMDIS